MRDCLLVRIQLVLIEAKGFLASFFCTAIEMPLFVGAEIQEGGRFTMEIIGDKFIQLCIISLLNVLSGLDVAWAVGALGREPSAVPGTPAEHSN